MDLSVIPAKRPGNRHSREVKAQAGVLYVIYGNVARVARELGIDENAIHRWIKTDWWEPLMAECRKEVQGEVDAKATQIIRKTQDRVIDALENGDARIDRKTGQEYRVPVAARDAAWMGAVWFDKQRIIRNQPTSIVSSPAMLGDLADRIRKIEDKEDVKIVSDQ